jgi:transposase-like protein
MIFSCPWAAGEESESARLNHSWTGDDQRNEISPRVINTDKAKCYPAALHESKEEGILRKRCRHRPVQYLNNILEQDHRAIKKRIRANQHFRQFGCARRTIQGYEVIHKIRKGQVR